MEKKNRYFGGISSALLKENFRQQWFIPALLFILYLISGIFPILMMDRESRGFYAVRCIANTNIIFDMFMTVMPMIAACLVMRYYHRPDMAFALHSQPYSRGKLFCTQILTGWLMLAVPVILTGLIFMAVSGSVELPIYGDGITGWEPAYTAGGVLWWMAESISIYTFYFGLCVLAGSLVGNTVTQILGSMVFYAVVPALTGIVYLYSESCLPGYNSDSDGILKIFLYSEPFIGKYAASQDAIVIPNGLWYFAAGLILVIAAGCIMRKAKLEKVGDSMIFGPVEAAVTVVITFIGGAVLGLLFGAVFNDGFGMYLLGALIGAAISFFLLKLILARSVRIFNKVNFRTFAAAAAVIVIFLLVFVTDITGYGTRVPAERDIKEVNVKGVSERVLRLNNYDMYDTEGRYVSSKVFTDDREFIGKVNALHRYAADNKLYDLKAGEKAPEMEAEFEYVLKNGKTFRRLFTIRVDETAEEMLRDIVNHKAVDEVTALPEALKDAAVRADVEIQLRDDNNEVAYLYGEIPRRRKDEIRRFIDVYNKDRENDVITQVAWNDEDGMYDTGQHEPAPGELVYANISIYYEPEDKNDERYLMYGESDPCVRIGIGPSDEDTTALIKELCEKYPADY